MDYHIYGNILSNRQYNFLHFKVNKTKRQGDKYGVEISCNAINFIPSDYGSRQGETQAKKPTIRRSVYLVTSKLLHLIIPVAFQMLMIAHVRTCSFSKCNKKTVQSAFINLVPEFMN